MGKRRILFIIAVVVLLCLSGLVVRARTREIPDRISGSIYFYNMSGLIRKEEDLFRSTAPGGDCIIVESDGRWGLIDAGFRYEDSITDIDGTVYSVPAEQEAADGKREATGLSCQVEGKNGKDLAAFLHDVLGVERLDFVIATHGHSDHVGGVPDVAAYTYTDADGAARGLVDGNTVYLAKAYRHVSPLDDDLGQEIREDSWHSQAYVREAERAMAACGALVIDVSGGLAAGESLEKEDGHEEIVRKLQDSCLTDAQFDPGEDGDPFDDSLTFGFGSLSVTLYNLYSVDSAANDNVNSIAAVITDGRSAAFTAGDLDAEWSVEQKVSAAVADRFGTMDLIKADHHGHIGSNTRQMLDSLRPKAIVITRCCDLTPAGHDQITPAAYYAEKQKGYTEEVFETALSGRAVAARFGASGIRYYDLQVRNGKPVLRDASGCRRSSRPRDGWYAWSVQHMTGPGVDYCYFQDGVPATGWRKIDGNGKVTGADQAGRWFYFDSLGLMAQDWKKIEGKWYYFGTDGVMTAGTSLELGGILYRFADSGECLNPEDVPGGP